VFFYGLIKENNLCGIEFIANTNSKKNVVEGLIYKYNHQKVEKALKAGKTFKVEKVGDLFDIDYKLERVTGFAIDSYEIEDIP
jgi:predicted secreted protein